MKRRYEVLEGTHYENETPYSKGNIVESEQPLDRLFVNKFNALDGPSPLAQSALGIKVVVDGGRSGLSDSPPDESATTAIRSGLPNPGPPVSAPTYENWAEGAEEVPANPSEGDLDQDPEPELAKSRRTAPRTSRKR